MQVNKDKERAKEIKVLPDLLRDFQSIRAEDTGEKPSKAPSTFLLLMLWFSMEETEIS